MNQVITKRLHVSGLTPSISPDVLLQKLSTFGHVKSMDCFGLKNGVGLPRKFGYVTIETTSEKLSRCLTLLNGTTWKGAKLRIGEAKPDYAERLRLERETTAEPPKKRRRNFGAEHAEDMTLVTAEKAANRPGWKVTPLGRIIRPIKMRPVRPLPAMQEETALVTKSKSDRQTLEKTKKKRVKIPDTRARRRTIDMTKWGSVHLKGMFLDIEVPAARYSTLVSQEKDNSLDHLSDEDGISDDENEVKIITPLARASPPKAHSPPNISQPSQHTLEHTVPIVQGSVKATANDIDVSAEKVSSLKLLGEIFGKDEDDWLGRESVGSGIDEDELTKNAPNTTTEDFVETFDIVPMDHPIEGPSLYAIQKKESSKLKELFAPQEREAGFSLIGHLDLDLEMDEAPFPTLQDVEMQVPTSTEISVLQAISSNYSSIPVLDNKQPLFFPHPKASYNNNKARSKDIFDVVKDNGCNWRDPSFGFYRTETEENIRKRWEEERGELTKEWKKRHREAVKMTRRRGMKGMEEMEY